ncbi:MAG: AAA family ATPase [Planctomycetaceae bacterium]|jgi:type II secretory pathway predicted ATPase ExeA|nr:AAA family ATPase [Planctomycetaceae bacterium]
MYETFFGLKRRPFLAIPDAESYFPTPQMEEARLLIERTVRRGEGISLIFGQSGIGKSLLLRILRNSLEFDFDIASLVGGRIDSVKALFQNILHELNLPYAGINETELRLILDDYAKTQSAGLLFLIDESQFLDRVLIDEIRLLLNADDGSNPLFRIVLAGTNELEEKLTLPQFDSFNQRVTTRIYLDTFSRTETFQYITQQTDNSKYNEFAKSVQTKQNKKQISNSAISANAEFFNNNNSDDIDVVRIDLPHNKNSESIFTDSAKDEIFRLTNGLPRQINQLCDIALQIAAQQVNVNIDEILILAAWGKLQQFNIGDDMLSKQKDKKDKTEKNKSESYTEIIARKKNTMRLKEINSHVEYGPLDDDTKFVDIHEEQRTQPVYQVYKPPYPEDDLNEFKKIDIEQEENTSEYQSVNQVNNFVLKAVNTNNLETELPENNEIDDDLVEQLISFELNTATIGLSNQATNTSADLLSKSFNNSTCSLQSLQSLQFLQHQLFASKINQVVVKKGTRRFIVRFFPPANDNSNEQNNNEQNNNEQNSNEESLRKVFIAHYCYKKYEFNSADDHQSKCKLPKQNGEINLFFTVWRNRVVHSWIGNLSAGYVKITARIFNAKNRINTKPELNNDTTEFSIISINSRDIDSEEDNMNRESLEEYGAAVLSGRPQFIRKEPNYVYQNSSTSELVNELNKIKDEINVNVELEIKTILEPKNNVTKIQTSNLDNETVQEQNNYLNKQDTKISEKYNSNLNSTLEKDLDSDYSIIHPVDNTNLNTDKIISIWTNPEITSNEITSNEITEETKPYSDKNYVDFTKEPKPDSNVENSKIEIKEIEIKETDEIENIVESNSNGIVLNWIEPCNSERGFGVAYRDFAAKDKTDHIDTDSISADASVIADWVDKRNTQQNSFDEHFEETVRVRRAIITLDDVYRSVCNFQTNQQGSPEILLSAERQITDIIKRIMRAADKIEIAAEQAEDAGRKINNAAELTNIAGQNIDRAATNVETEIKAAIPNYKDLFIQLSDFQKTLTQEVKTLMSQKNYLSDDNGFGVNGSNINDSADSDISKNENNILLNQSRTHELKTYRGECEKRLSRTGGTDNIKLPTAEKRDSNIKAIDINSLFLEGDL